MNSQDIKTAAAESNESCDKNSDITTSQFIDLVCYILANAEKQQQPELFTPPVGADELRITSDQNDTAISVWLADSWPVAVEDHDAECHYVLTGVPVFAHQELRKIVPESNRLSFIPTFFVSPQGECMVADWMRRHTNYDGGCWEYYIIPGGSTGKTGPHTEVFLNSTGYIAPISESKYQMIIPGNYFDHEISADAAGIIATLMVLNWLSCEVAEKGESYAHICKKLTERQDALKDYVSIINHPEASLIYRAID
ncbi:antirestriction protein [Entomohabitans teleogrylli]|uniref:antirestriction protein n=1 Tax=Entomohabitans teleogrylli TaxID=1384589 RepID=UPI00073D6037|nr:antirestriction protein [Entomohabitans teleogrylli]